MQKANFSITDNKTKNGTTLSRTATFGEFSATLDYYYTHQTISAPYNPDTRSHQPTMPVLYYGTPEKHGDIILAFSDTEAYEALHCIAHMLLFCYNHDRAISAKNDLLTLDDFLTVAEYIADHLL